jgi:hypothetical protein
MGWLAAAILLASCSSGSEEEGRALGKETIATEVKPVPQATVTPKQIGSEPDGSASQSLLHVWSRLQMGKSEEAAKFYEDDLIQYLGSKRVTAGFSTQGELYRATRPIVVKTCIVDVRRVVVLYRIRADGQEGLWAMTWTRTANAWEISYDPLLDRALKEEAEKRVQSRIDPHQQVLAQAAVSAGAEAASLQLRYIMSRKDPPLVMTTRPPETQLASCREPEVARTPNPSS